jgi:uncharacterized protein
MLRFSSYSILSDRMPGGGYILMSGVSGSLDIISDSLGSLLESTISQSPHLANKLLPQVDPEVQAHWREQGYVTELSIEAERALVVELAGAIHEAVARKPVFMIVPNLDCNYRCTYCFERPLQNGLNILNSNISHHLGNVVMNFEAARSAYSAIATLQQQAGLPSGGQLILYGGEPLDKRNDAIVREIVRLGRIDGFTFAAITNGHDLDNYLDLLGKKSIEQVQVSIDGPKRVHDKRRIYLGNESSFDRLVKNIKSALEFTSVEMQIRVHVDPSNISLFGELLDFFGTLGWIDNPQVVIYSNTVYSKDKTGSVITGFEVAEIDRMLRAMVHPFRNVYTSAPDIHATRAMEGVFANGQRFSIKGTYCSANSGNYIFAPDGAIYACWESVGKECSRIGWFTGREGLTLDPRATERWFNRSIATLPACQQCQYALICGGGCAQYAEYKTGTLYSPYCDDFQRTFRSTLAHACDKHFNDVVPICDSPAISSTAAAGQF